MENECEALAGVAYPGVRDNCSTINTKTGYDDDDDKSHILALVMIVSINTMTMMITQNLMTMKYLLTTK